MKNENLLQTNNSFHFFQQGGDDNFVNDDGYDMPSIFSDLKRLIDEHYDLIALVIFEKLHLQDPLPLYHYKCRYDRSSMVKVYIVITSKNNIHINENNDPSDFSYLQVEKIDHPDIPKLIDMYNTRDAPGIQKYSHIEIDINDGFVHSENSIYFGKIFNPNIETILDDTTFDVIPGNISRIYCYEIAKNKKPFVYLNSQHQNELIYDFIHKNLEEGFSKFTYRREEDAEEEDFRHINVSKNDISQFKCYTHRWDTYLNPKVGGFSSTRQYAPNVALNYLHEVRNCKRSDMDDYSDPEHSLNRELEFKIGYYRYVFSTKAYISCNEGVRYFDENLNKHKTTNIVYRGMSQPYRLHYSIEGSEAEAYLLKNYTSTTTVFGTALAFITKNPPPQNPILYKITLTPGIPYISIDEQPFTSYHPGESEILFCENCILTITSPPIIIPRDRITYRRQYTLIECQLSYMDVASLSAIHTSLESYQRVGTFITFDDIINRYEFPPRNQLNYQLFRNPQGTLYWGGRASKRKEGKNATSKKRKGKGKNATSKKRKGKGKI